MTRANSENGHEIVELVMRERRMAVSDREWRHRLRGYGYGIRDTDEGRVVTSLVRGSAICSLPGHQAA
ncbi:hypothetical protein DQW77_14840 [Roseovarius sp. TE539]|uniref:hypothetical protein n=1 Tax=Roseovarius sp. TE539 TaxID=2249812 RepID=UPI000DDF19A6|nr:hypothetical protein [Roseovarius sp. TE539]RBI69948.1 hypothetical protein DQW77_14840 [Roseovarius sp. TE539]